MNKGCLKQMLIITDGCSNQGEDPVAMAALAMAQGITVNVIGVLDNDAIDKRGLQEIEGIASSGGGISQVVHTMQLSQTVQMVTRKAMTQTLQGVVNRELRQILGNEVSIEKLSPEKRAEVIEVVDELGETADVEVLVLIDTSASMKYKLPTVKEALLDLSLSLNARMGSNRFAALVFPGKRSEVEQLMDWTPNLEMLTKIFPKLSTGGITPTGPAIREAMSYFNTRGSVRRLISPDEEQYFDESM